MPTPPVSPRLVEVMDASVQDGMKSVSTVRAVGGRPCFAFRRCIGVRSKALFFLGHTYVSDCHKYRN